jgi:hypothetical protein
MGRSIANAGAYCKKSGTNIKVAISTRANIRASSGKNAFRLALMPFLLCRALSVYSRGVNK